MAVPAACLRPIADLRENYLGFPRGISGAELTQRAYQQAWLFGAKFVFAREVNALCTRGTEKVLKLSDGREIVATAVVVATGATYRRLEVPALERFVGRSIFYTTLGEGRFACDLDVAVTGGGNSAGQAALHLAGHARRVTLIVRAGSLEKGMSDYLVLQIRAKPNIDVRLGGGGGRRRAARFDEARGVGGGRRRERRTERASIPERRGTTLTRNPAAPMPTRSWRI